MTFTVWLALPPPANNAYVNRRGGGRILSDKARAWQLNAVKEIKAFVSTSVAMKTPFDVLIELPEAMPGDIDGRIKLPVDALVMSGRVPDDKHMRGVTAQRCGAIPSGKARITVTPAMAYGLAGGEAP